MKILIVSSFFPHPLYSGGQVRLFNLLKQLSERHRITLISPIRSSEEKKHLPKIEKFCQKVILTYRGSQWSLRNILLTALSLQPFLFVGHRSEEMEQKITEELESQNYDLIQVETSYVMSNLPATNLPVVLSEYNIEYLVYKKYVDNFQFFFFKPFLYFDVWKMKKWERKMWEQADYIFTVSKRDKEKIIRRGIEKERVFIVPNGVDIKKFKVQSPRSKVEKRKTILFLGDFRWFPNRDAIEWLLKEIWPEIRFKVQGSRFKVNLVIAGRGSEKLKERVEDKNVRVVGAVRDIGEIYGQADVLLAPMRIGGGTKFKILEAMAGGLPVVTTSVGIEGITAKNGQEVMIREGTEGLVKATIELLSKADLREKLANNARKLVEEKYNWKKIAKKLEKIYYPKISAL